MSNHILCDLEHRDSTGLVVTGENRMSEIGESPLLHPSCKTRGVRLAGRIHMAREKARRAVEIGVIDATARTARVPRIFSFSSMCSSQEAIGQRSTILLCPTGLSVVQGHGNRTCSHAALRHSSNRFDIAMRHVKRVSVKKMLACQLNVPAGSARVPRLSDSSLRGGTLTLGSGKRWSDCGIFQPVRKGSIPCPRSATWPASPGCRSRPCR